MFPFCKYISKPWSGNTPEERDSSLMMELFIGATLKYQNLDIISSDYFITKYEHEPEYEKYRHMHINHNIEKVVKDTYDCT